VFGEGFCRGAPSQGMRGRVLRVWAMAAMSSAVQRERSVSFGKYWRNQPLVFSLVPRCHGLLGSAKYSLTPEAIENWACADSSLPRSQSTIGATPKVAW
jgi:hypothetical protein